MKFTSLLLAILICCLPCTSQTITSDQLKKGMKGTGKTVFSGALIEDFDVEVLGLMTDTAPSENRVLIRCAHPTIKDSGIIRGMSGSPVYFDGKLAGAVSFGWEFGKEPIGGLTPIEAMRDIIARYETGKGQNQIRFEKLPNLNRILNPDNRSLMPPELEKVLERNLFMATGFDTLPFQYVQGSGTGQDPDAPRELAAGSSVAVALVRGDLNLFSLGTVTEVSDKRVLAFGHPMFGLGSISVPMHTASVLATYPSIRISNKIGGIGPEVGSVVEDRNAGILGILNRKAQTIPLSVKLNLPGDTREFNMDIAVHPLLSPFLVNLSLSTLLDTVCVKLGYNTFNARGRIDLEQHPDVTLEALIPDTATTSMSTQIATIVQTIMQNPFDDVRVNGITLDLNYVEDLRFAQLMKVKADRTRVRPGETVHVQLYIKPFKRGMFIKNVTLQIPENVPDGTYLVEAGDGLSIMGRESKVLQKRIESLDGFIRMVNGFLKSNKIYVGVAQETDALFMGETVQSSLPGSISETVRMQGVHIPRTDKWKEYRAVDVVTLNDFVQGYVTFPIQIQADIN